MIESIIFIYGLMIGSFLNVVILRLDEAETIINGRSHCPKCKTNLAWYDLVPVISYILLQGKCRYCKKPISWQYPIVELATAIFLVLTFRLASVQAMTTDWQIAWMAFYTIIIAALVVIFFYDLYHYVIPDEIVWPAIILVSVFRLAAVYIGGNDIGIGMEMILLGGLVGAGVPAALALPSRGTWMGYGDIKLGALIGLLLGYPLILFGLFGAFVIGGVIGIVLLLEHKKKLTSMIPFGPFMVSGTLIAIFWGNAIINWYLGLFMARY